MNFEATIDLVKYTLALSAACFAYTLEKLVPAPTVSERWFVLAVLATFIVAILSGIAIFSSATAALHGDAARAGRQRKRIKRIAFLHLGCIALGTLLLGAKLVEKVLTDVPAQISVTRAP